MSGGPAEGTPHWQHAMRLTTAVFTVWFFAVVYRSLISSLVATGFERLHRHVGAVRTPSEGEIASALAGVTKWGLALSVALFFVAFGLFHRASNVERVAD